MTSMRKTIQILFVFSLFVLAAFAQTETGQIVGTVTDASGAVLPAATVTAKNVNTGATRNSTTNESGFYTFTNLPPGSYEVTVNAQGFAPYRQKLEVTVGARTSVNASLKTGAATETIEVVGDTQNVQVDTVTSTLSQTVNATAMASLPTLTRNPYDLVATAGNVSADADGATGRGVGVAINGQRAASTNILLDGGENVDNFTATVGQSVPLDSVQELSVVTNNFSPEYGRASGGIVNVATKSGTNAFHGTLYEFYRGAKFAANTPENKANGLPRDNFVRNQFGYSVGGPVLREKLFFFSSTEWTRVRSSQNRQYYVPTPAFIAAANSATQNFFTAYGALAAPITTVVTKGALVSGGLVGAGTPGTPWGDYPLTSEVFGLVTTTIPVDVGGGDPQNTVRSVARMDLNLSDRTQIFARYGIDRSAFFAGTVSDSPYAGFNTGAITRNQNGLLSLTRIISNSFVSQSKVVYNRLMSLNPVNGPSVPTLFYRGSRTIVDGKRAYLPGYLPGSPGSGIPFGGPQNLYQLYQDFNWTKGNHQFRFGATYVHMRDNRVFGAYANSPEQLGTNLTNGLDGFLRGQLVSFRTAIDPQGKLPCNWNYTTASATVTPACTVTLPASQPKFGRNNRFNDYAFYFGDNWKVTSRFSLNLGVRYEYYGVQHNSDPALDANFYFGSGSSFFEQYRNGGAMLAKDSPVGGLWAPDRNNWAPRLGFAWDIFGTGKVSLRGGYGISYERNFGNVTFNAIQNPPNYFVASLTPSSLGAPIPVSTDNLGPFAGSVGAVPLRTPSLRHILQNIRTAYSQSWNLSVENELARNTVLAIDYAGSRGNKLYTLEDPNRLGSGVIYNGDDPTINPFSQMNNTYGIGSFNRANRGDSYYHGMNVRLRTTDTLVSGLTFSANYTWSHAIDNLSSTFSDSFANYNVGLLDPFNPGLDRGNADFDVRQRVAISGVYAPPIFKDGNPVLKHVLGGWEFAPIFVARTGTPFTLYDFTNGFFYAPRVQMAGPATFAARGQVLDANLYNYMQVPANVGAYVNPLTGLAEHGNCTVPGQGATAPCPWPADMARRNSFRGPNNWNINLGIYKNFPVTERVKLQFRGEFYNLPNHPNDYIETGSLDVSGCATTLCDVPTKKFNKRDVQLAVKIIF